jgi:hypothetical protein
MRSTVRDMSTMATDITTMTGIDAIGEITTTGSTSAATIGTGAAWIAVTNWESEVEPQFFLNSKLRFDPTFNVGLLMFAGLL